MKNLTWKIRYIYYPLFLAWFIETFILSWLAPIGKKSIEYLEKHPQINPIKTKMNYIENLLNETIKKANSEQADMIVIFPENLENIIKDALIKAYIQGVDDEGIRCSQDNAGASL